MGNAALSLEWVECMRKICLFELKSADLRIYFFSSQVRLLFEVGPWLVLNAVKHCIFRKSAAVLISFRFKTAKFIRGNVFPIKCKRMCFFERALRRLFCRAAFFPVYAVWIAFVGFITLGSICITFECINYYS